MSSPRASRRAMLLAGVGGALALAGCGGSDSQAGEIVRFAAGKRPAAPEVKGSLLDGSGYDLAGQRGKVVVINFWASWCAPCRLEAKYLEQVYTASKPSGVEFLGINIRDEKDQALAFEQGRSSYPSLSDPAGRVALGFRDVPPNTVPATLVIDRDGRIAAVIRRPVQDSDLQPIVTEIAAEKAA